MFLFLLFLLKKDGKSQFNFFQPCFQQHCKSIHLALGTWAPHSTTQVSRYRHTSWVSPAGLLLLGGWNSQTTSEFVSGGLNFTLSDIP